MAPNYVLVLGPQKSGKVRLAQYITGDYGTDTILNASHSGLIYNCDLNTKYFSLNVSILIEEFPENRADAKQDVVQYLNSWFEEFSSEEFLELRKALDGVVYTIPMDKFESKCLEEQLDVVAKIKDLIDEDSFFVVAGSATGEIDPWTVEEIEDQVISNGFEFVNLQDSGTNEFLEKVGRDRLMEIFQSHMWTDMDKIVQSQEKYVNHKRDKIAGMTKGLLEMENQDKPERDIDLERILQKLRIDKEKVDALKEHEKREFVDKLVEEYLEYF